MIDCERLRADLGALARECRALKNVLGTTWTRPMADEQRRFARLRWRATELCVLRGWMRNKRHVTTAPRAIADSGADWDAGVWHARIAQRVAKDYEKADGSVEGAAR